MSTKALGVKRRAATRKDKLEEAKAALIEALKRVMEWKATDSWIPYVELWERGPWGVRVAELGSVALDGSGGSAALQVDPPCFAVCFAAERWLLYYLYSDEIGIPKGKKQAEELENCEWGLKEAWTGHTIRVDFKQYQSDGKASTEPVKGQK